MIDVISGWTPEIRVTILKDKWAYTLRSYVFLLLASIVAYAQKIEISPNGPIKTLDAARDAARELRQQGKTGPITIIVHAGTYYLPETLVLGPEDSDTIWEAPHGEHPVISGGRVILGWKKDGPVWKASVQGPYFRQLFVDGHRATRARTPNEGFFRSEGDKLSQKPYALHYRGSDIRESWAGHDVEVVAEVAWSDLRSPIVRVDEVAHVATLASDPPDSNQEKDARYFVENAPDALDAQGEWYLDPEKHVVSYIPFGGEDMTRALVIAPSLQRLVSLEGKAETGQFVQNVIFRGLTFAHADWTMDAGGYVDLQAGLPASAAINAVGAVHFVIEHCTIAHSGGHGIFLGRGSRDNSVVSTELFDLGAGGIKIGEPKPSDENADRNYGNIIADNQIHDLGLVYTAGVGIWILESSQNQVVHNHIHDLFYSGISVGWTWGYGPNQSNGNVIAFNHIHAIGKDTLSDMGGIYTLGVQPGTIIQNNLIHDVSSFTYGGWGIYTDEGSSYIKIEDNIVYHCKSAGFHQNYGRENILRNNIFAFNHEHQLMRTRAEEHSSFTMENNIIYFDQGDLLGSNWADAKLSMRRNMYYDVRQIPIRFAGKSFAEWKALGEDPGSIIADPLFVNAKNFDFRLRAKSLALQTGFHQIDMTHVGPRTRSGADAW
jgi:parallel beta-helix repeat protein